MPDKKQPELQNDALELVMKTFKEAQNNENMTALLQAVAAAKIMQPALLPAGLGKEDIQKMVQNGKNTLDPKLRPQPMIIKNPQGENFIPVFTSNKHIPAGQNYPAMLFIPFMQCAKLAGNPDLKLSGVVLNPFTDNLVLHKAAMDILNKNVTQPQKKQVTLTPEQMHVFIRSQVEVSDLPKALYQEKKSFMQEMMSQKEKQLHQFYEKAYGRIQGAKIACPYKEEDFEIMALNISDRIQMVRMGMPVMHMTEGTCTVCFAFLNPETEEAVYYVVRKGKAKEKNSLGKIDEQGKYEALGEAPGEGEELYTLMDMLPWK